MSKIETVREALTAADEYFPMTTRYAEALTSLGGLIDREELIGVVEGMKHSNAELDDALYDEGNYSMIYGENLALDAVIEILKTGDKP